MAERIIETKIKLTGTEEYVAGIDQITAGLDRMTSALQRANEAMKEFSALFGKMPDFTTELRFDGEHLGKEIAALVSTVQEQQAESVGAEFARRLHQAFKDQKEASRSSQK